MNNCILKSIINGPLSLINKTINTFLFALFKNIFLNIKEYELDGLDNQLNIFIDKINYNIIKKKDKYISKDYSIKNFNNIVDFVKSQNTLYAADIIQGILIYIFSFAFKTEKNKTLRKFIFNNLSGTKNRYNFNFDNCLQKGIIKYSIYKDIEQLLEKESNFDLSTFNELKNYSPFFNLLYLIYENKNKHFLYKNYGNNKLNYYINKGPFENCREVYNNFDNDKNEIGIIRAFFISVFIYYQNKNSPLMKYIDSSEEDKKKGLVNIPFKYDLEGANVDGRNADIIISPIRIEPRIDSLLFSLNNLKESGLLELSKALLFNKNIKTIDHKKSLIKSHFLDCLNYGLGIFNNNNVETLILSYNLLDNNCDEYLAKLISHFQGLKTLNLSFNNFKGGMTHFFIALKKLYRNGKTRLENIYLNNCHLDSSSFYELEQLLKCKYCKLKYLSLNNKGNIIMNNNTFLKGLKKNKSLQQIYLPSNNIGSRDTNNIMKIISNTRIKHLYLYKNKINNFNDGLKIIYRTKLIKDHKDRSVVFNNDSSLINLDLSKNDFSHKNSEQVNLLNKIVGESTLSCLDVSSILYGSNHKNKNIIIKYNLRYRKNVEILKELLEGEKEKYYQINKKLETKRVDYKRQKDNENEIIFKNLNEKIFEIIKDKKAEFPLYLKINAKNLLKDKENKYIFGNIIEADKESKINIEKIEQRLINYMQFQKTKNDIICLEEQIKNMKLILI